jgi:rare lipoprotein A
MIIRLRRSATNMAVAMVLVGLTASGPVNAVEIQQPERLLSLSNVVSTLDEDKAVAKVDAVEAAIPEARFEHLGQGMASYYGAELAGNRTASGERFNPSALTAAHRSLPLGTKLRVTNNSNGKSVIVRVNDRGPFTRNRVLDLSLAAAREIAMVRSGHAKVTLEIVRPAIA